VTTRPSSNSAHDVRPTVPVVPVRPNGADASWRRALIALALFVGTWLAYRPGTVSQSYNKSDPLLLVPTSMSLLYDHDLDLSEFAADFDPSFHGILLLDGRPYNRYPVGASLVILPLVWLKGPPDPGVVPMTHAVFLAGSIAKKLAAFSVALLFLLLAILTDRNRLALGLALLFAFATPHYPIHAGGLWTHNAVLPLVLVAMLLLVVRHGRHAWSAAIPLGLAFVTRPTTVPLIALLSVYVALRHRRQAPVYAFLGLAIAGIFCAWSQYMYGTLLPPYYRGFQTQSPTGITGNPVPSEALLGNLVSPNRGLFVFVPVFVFSLWGIVHAFRSGIRHTVLLRTVAIVVVAHWVMISTLCGKWWAGWSFGPRNFMDILPLFVVLLAPAIDALGRLPARARAVVTTLAALAVAWGLFVAVYGANAMAPHLWSAQPLDIDLHPERLWDWHDMQILRGTGLQ